MKLGIVGLDLSLRAAAAAFVPRTFKGDTKQVKVNTWGYELERGATEARLASRRAHIADGIRAWIVGMGRTTLIEHVYIEEYAFSRNSSSATGLHELGAVVKDRLLAQGLPFTSVPASAARKTMLQKLPKKDSKQFTEDNVRRLGGEALYWNADEVDAFVVANHGMMLMGWTPLSFEGTPDGR